MLYTILLINQKNPAEYFCGIEDFEVIFRNLCYNFIRNNENISTFLKYTKKKNTKSISTSHMFEFSVKENIIQENVIEI